MFINSSYSMGSDKFSLDKITLPPNFKIRIYADNVPNARSITPGPEGVFFVGSRSAGKVYAVLDRNGDYKADEIIVIDRRLRMPNGVAYKSKDLYVAEIHRVLKYKDIINNLYSPGVPEVINDTFPGKRWHGWKFIRFGPDRKLYVPVGAPCNVCVLTWPPWECAFILVKCFLKNIKTRYLLLNMDPGTGPTRSVTESQLSI